MYKKKLSHDNIKYLLKIIELNDFKYEKLNEKLDIGSILIMSFLPFFVFLMIGWAIVMQLFYSVNIIEPLFAICCFLLTIGSLPIIFFNLDDININKKRNKEMKNLFENNEHIFFYYIEKNSNTLNTLKKLFNVWEELNLITLKDGIYSSELTIKQFNKLLLNKIEKNKIKRKEFLKI